MINSQFLTKIVLRALFALTLLQFAVQLISAQAGTRPKQEKLLNGLKVLMWSDPKADKVWVKLRIHSGSAFDPQGKEGVMQMLSDNLFPNEAAKEFFVEDLGGSLDVQTTYDYVQINASAKPESFLTMMETIATAVGNPPIDKETTAKLRAALLAKMVDVESDPVYVADRAASARLFGTFPYGRSILGTMGSLQKIEFADLLDARQRFLTADNATVAISGNFDRALAMKALRRYFGGWLKSDKRVPSTFRQPDEPTTAIVELPSPKPGTTEVRYAFRGVARGDKDLGASLIFSQIVENRLKARMASGQFSGIFVRNEPHMLPGLIVAGYSSPARSDIKKEDLFGPIRKSVADPISDAEFTAVKQAVVTSWSGKDPAISWLDADTYQIADVDSDPAISTGVSFSDVRAYAERVQKLPAVTVVAITSPKAN